MPSDPQGTDVAEDLRRTLDAAHDTALRAVHAADARALRAHDAARAQRVRAAAAIEVAAEELATLATALREDEEAADPLETAGGAIHAREPEPEPEPEPKSAPEPAPPPESVARPRTAAARRASLHDSPIASMLKDSARGPAPEPHPRPEPPRPAELARPAEVPEAVVVRGRPGLVEAWRRRIAVR